MIKAKKIGLILDRDIALDTQLKNGMIIRVTCELIEADYDRLYLRFPLDKLDLAQYFYDGKKIKVHLDTIDGIQTYDAIILYQPEDELIVVEYYEFLKFSQKRNALRIKTSKVVDLEYNDTTIPMITINLSASGMKLISSQILEKDKIYTAYLSLLAGTKQIKLNIKVINVVYLSAENKYEIASEFIDINEKDKKTIMKYCFDVQTNYLKENIE